MKTVSVKNKRDNFYELIFDMDDPDDAAKFEAVNASNQMKLALDTIVRDIKDLKDYEKDQSGNDVLLMTANKDIKDKIVKAITGAGLKI